jgi:hypothetical protein
MTKNNRKFKQAAFQRNIYSAPVPDPNMALVRGKRSITIAEHLGCDDQTVRNIPRLHYRRIDGPPYEIKPSTPVPRSDYQREPALFADAFAALPTRLWEKHKPVVTPLAGSCRLRARLDPLPGVGQNDLAGHPTARAQLETDQAPHQQSRTVVFAFAASQAEPLAQSY